MGSAFAVACGETWPQSAVRGQVSPHLTGNREHGRPATPGAESSSRTFLDARGSVSTLPISRRRLAGAAIIRRQPTLPIEGIMTTQQIESNTTPQELELI